MAGMLHTRGWEVARSSERRRAVACGAVRQLLPVPVADVDLYEAYRTEPGVPLLRLNMVATVDGAVQDGEGRAGGLGGEGDNEVFRVLRALSDGIMVGAGTARTEGYGPHRLRADLARRRAAAGRPNPAPIVLVSRSMDLDLDTPLFTEAKARTVVITCGAAPAERVRAARRVATVIVAGDEIVDLAAGVAALRDELGLTHLLCEGGPTLNGGLLAANLVDELCLTLAPSLAGEERLGLTVGPTRRAGLGLAGLCEQDGELFLRYRVVKDR
jgi:riboflavin biosynthesis pyrimidine reductase